MLDHMCNSDQSLHRHLRQACAGGLNCSRQCYHWGRYFPAHLVKVESCGILHRHQCLMCHQSRDWICNKSSLRMWAVWPKTAFLDCLKSKTGWSGCQVSNNFSCTHLLIVLIWMLCQQIIFHSSMCTSTCFLNKSWYHHHSARYEA